MSRALITDSYLTGIANAIRAKLGVQDTYTPPQMAAAIESIPTGGITPTGTKQITQNGTHDVTQYASANVNVQPNLQSKTATQNGTIEPDQGYDGLSSVVVNVSQASPTIDVLYSQQSGHTLANPWSYTGTIQHSGKLIVSFHAYSGSTKFILNGVEKPLDVSGVEYTYGLNAIFDVNVGDTINTYSNMSGKSDGGIIVVLVY